MRLIRSIQAYRGFAALLVVAFHSNLIAGEYFNQTIVSQFFSFGHSGVPFFFQALDAEGRAVQTMRSLTYVQPGEMLSCVGCHESRETTPGAAAPIAMTRDPASWTLPAAACRISLLHPCSGARQ